MPFRLRQRPTLLLAMAVLLVVSGLVAQVPGYPLRTAVLVGWCAGAATGALGSAKAGAANRAAMPPASAQERMWCWRRFMVLSRVMSLVDGYMVVVAGRHHVDLHQFSSVAADHRATA